MTTWILLRGLTRGVGHWGRFINAFEQAQPGCQIIALDLPGNGHLNMQKSPLHVQYMVAHCRAQLADRHIAPPYHLMAMSLGAMVAVDWAHTFPQEIAGSVLINTSLRTHSAFYQRLRPANYGALLKLAILGASANGWEQAILRMTSNHDRADVLPEWVALREAFGVSRRNALAQLLAAARFRARCDRPMTPTLLLVSECDHLVAASCSKVLAHHWHCDLSIHPSAGHDIALDDGPWVIEEVLQWLKAPDIQWHAQLQARINRPPCILRAPLLCGKHQVGSVDSDAFNALVTEAGLDAFAEIQINPVSGETTWRISGDATASLAKIAQGMRSARYARVAEQWRDELLAVKSEAGRQIATVERGAVRALGITTHGVHLVGRTSDMRYWIQHRAWNKSTDPGQWDTLMGGMISALDTVETALARETQEEAGIGLDQLINLRWGGHFTMRTPNSESNGLEYWVERIDWFESLVPGDVCPRNTDGEVQEFRQVSRLELAAMLKKNIFTLEAAVVFAQCHLCHCDA